MIDGEIRKIFKTAYPDLDEDTLDKGTEDFLRLVDVLVEEHDRIHTSPRARDDLPTLVDSTDFK